MIAPILTKGMGGYHSMNVTQGYGDLGLIFRRAIKMISRTTEIIKYKSRLNK